RVAVCMRCRSGAKAASDFNHLHVLKLRPVGGSMGEKPTLELRCNGRGPSQLKGPLWIRCLAAGRRVDAGVLLAEVLEVVFRRLLEGAFAAVAAEVVRLTLVL